MAKRSKIYNEWGKTYKAFSEAILNAGKALNSIASFELRGVADQFLREEDAQWPHSTQVNTLSLKNGSAISKVQKFGGDAMHPWYSGQLHDSVAVRISNKNRTTSVHYMPPSPDTGKPQHTNTISGIIGAEWAREVAESKAPYYFLPGVQVQLIIGVPYTEKVNEEGRHMGFADNLADNLFTKVNDWINGGGLKRPTLIADEKGVRVINKSNVTRTRKK